MCSLTYFTTVCRLWWRNWSCFYSWIIYSHVNVQSRYFPLILHMISSSIFTSEHRGLDPNREVRAERHSHHRGLIPTRHETLLNLSLYLQHMEVFIFQTFIFRKEKVQFLINFTPVKLQGKEELSLCPHELLRSKIQHLFNLWAACSQHDAFTHPETFTCRDHQIQPYSLKE